MRVGRREISISNPDKVLWPDDGITKSDLISYYQAVSKVMIPDTRDRLMTLERFPDGIKSETFFSKAIPKYFPEWIDRKEVPKSGGTVTHVVCNNAATLIYLANQACITMHVGLSRISAIDKPDQLIFDLDPPEGDFEPAREASLTLRDILQDLGLKTFVKLTGSKGLHVMSPLKPTMRFEDVRKFSENVARELIAEHPRSLTMESRKAKRRGRVFVDVMRNSFAQTVVAPYTVRARPRAPVAAPVTWSEVEDEDITPQSFTIANTPARISKSGDPWKGWRGQARSLGAAARRLGLT